MSAEDGTFQAIDTHNSLPKWKTRLLVSQLTVPTVANDILYAGGSQTVNALEASTGK